MSAFEDRVNKIVDLKTQELFSILQDSDWDPSFEPILRKLEDIFNLLKEVKSEVYKTEKQTTPEPDPQEEEKQKKPRRKPTKQDWDDFLDLLRDDDPNNLKQWIEFIKRFEPELGPIKLPDGTLAFPVEDDTTLLEWITKEGPTSSITNYITSWITKKLVDFAVDKITAKNKGDNNDVKSYTSSQISVVREDISTTKQNLQSSIDDSEERINSNVDELEAKLEECCENMGAITSQIDHKIDLLDPVTNANNVLEILQKQKAILANLDDIRGRL